MSKIHEFQPLYQKKTGGKIYLWKTYITLESDDSIVSHTEYGYQNGQMQHQTKALKRAKGKKTPWEQAISEAQSKWNKKKDKEGFITDLSQASTVLTIRPMLA